MVGDQIMATINLTEDERIALIMAAVSMLEDYASSGEDGPKDLESALRKLRARGNK
jgi:hypothetical protein